MRILITLLLLVFLPFGAQAQQARLLVSNCVQPGGVITIQGDDFGNRARGNVVLMARPNAIPLSLRSWSNRRIRAVVPRSVQAGATYSVILAFSNDNNYRNQISVGQVKICGAGRQTAGRPNRARAARDVVPAPDGSPEYVVSVANNQAGAATNALQSRGATLLRTRPLPRLGRTLLFFAFPGDLSLGQARQLLTGAAPSARIDQHHIYGFADGPRVYASGMIGDDPARPCSLRRPVAVGLIDGPLNTGHPALAGVRVAQTSVLSDGERPVSAEHGTAVAGLIAGNPASGYPGFASGAQIFSAAAFSRGRGGEGARLENVAAGLDWLAGQRVRIVNLSMEGSPNAAFEDVLSRARGAGLVMIAAAGNEGTSNPRYPAASPATIAVTAVDANGRAYRRANQGGHIEFAAPGVDLYVARSNRGGYRSGTSYSAPIVSALIARQAARGGVSLDRARSALRRSVRDLGPAGRDAQFGYGLVQTGGC